MRTPTRPPLDGLKKRLEQSRAERARTPRDGFLRETFVLPRSDGARQGQGMVRPLAEAGLLDEIESWFERPGDVIEFTIRRLPSSD